MGQEVELFSHVAAYDQSLMAAGVALELDPLTTASFVTAMAAQDISQRLSRLLVISARTLRSVVEGLGATNESLQSLAEIAANPAAVRGEELRRRAAYALDQGWNEEAADDLRQSVDANPYDAIAWYLLARALYLTEHPSDAGAAYAKASRYGAPRSKPFAAFSLLAAAAAYDDAGDEDAALKALRNGTPGCAPCPDLQLAIAIRSRQIEDLAAAFTLDPSLVIDAAAAAFDGINDAAQLVFDQGLDAYVERCGELTNRLIRVLEEYDIPLPNLVARSGPASSASASLARTVVLLEAQRSALLSHRPLLDQLIAEPQYVRASTIPLPTHMPIGAPPSGMSAKQAAVWKSDSLAQEAIRYSNAIRAYEAQQAATRDEYAHDRWLRNVEELEALRDAIDASSRDRPFDLVRPEAILA